MIKKIKKSDLIYFPKLKLVEMVLLTNQIKKKRYVSLLSYCKEQKDLIISYNVIWDIPCSIEQTSIKLGYDND